MSRWIGAITNIGNDLLSEWVNEKTLHIDKVVFGTGTVSEESMVAQSNLVNQKQIGSIVGSEQVASGIRLKIQITAPDIGYTLNQIGVWARVENAVPVMLSLYQYDAGVLVPSKAESPEFVYTFYALISTSNQGQWSVSVDASAVVTQEQFSTHTLDYTNPHKVDCEQIGAVSVDEYAGLVEAELSVHGVLGHLEDSRNPHRVSWYQTGAAPGGYGYGGEPVTLSATQINSDSDLNTALETIYHGMKDRETKLVRFYGFPSSSDYVFFGFLFRSSENYGSFVAHSAYSKGCLISKARIYDTTSKQGVWQPLEWVNPPLVIGTEYRTTERFYGEPVYVKQLSFGIGPDDTSKEMNISDVVGDLVRIEGYWQSTSSFVKHPFATAEFLRGVEVYNIKLVVYATERGPGYTGWPVVYYTKRVQEE